MNTQALRSILIGIISNLITPFAIPVLAFIVGWFFTVSVESKLALLNTALILFLIFFLLYLHFSPKRLLIVRQSDRPEIYLIEKGIYRHIPDGETFDYLGQLFGFQWTDVNVMTPIEFKEKFSAGSILPSILPHCEKYCKKLRDEDSKQAKHKETMS